MKTWAKPAAALQGLVGKIRLAFLAMLLPAAAMTAISLGEIQAFHVAASRLDERELPALATIDELGRLQAEFRALQLEHLGEPGPSEIRSIEQRLENQRAAIARLFATYRQSFGADAGEEALLTEAETEWRRYLETSDSSLRASQRSDDERAFEILRAANLQLAHLQGTMVRWREANERDAAEALGGARVAYENARLVVALMLLPLILIGVSLSEWLGRIVSRYQSTNRALLEQSQLEAARAGIFNRLSERLSFASEEQDLVAGTIATLRRLTNAGAGDLLLLNPSLNRLTVAGSWGDGAAEPGGVVEIDTPTMCPGLRRGSTYLSANAADELAVHCAAHPSAAGAVLCVPLLALGQTIGVVHLETAASRGFSTAEQQLAVRVAEQAALAFANARLMRVMESQAMTDTLTGLPNVRFFDPLLERELAAASRDGTSLGVVMVDIDNFKKLNDAHGHPAGDEALKAFARILRSTLRASDTVARYGGEEFIVAVRHADLEATIRIAEKLRGAVEQATVEVAPGRHVRLTASFGVASTSAHGMERTVLIRVADQALYQAKKLGRNRVVAGPGSQMPSDGAAVGAGDVDQPMREASRSRVAARFASKRDAEASS